LIAILDTNALHSDIFATGPTVQTFLAAADNGRCEVRLPSVVVEELVRQFPERLSKLSSEKKTSGYDARAFGPEAPKLGEGQDPATFYRTRLSRNLDRRSVRIVGPPRRAEMIAEWIAQRRHPIPNDGRGAVDTQIWLTAVEAAEEDETILIAKNPKDFADPDDPAELHPVLKADLVRFGIEPGAVVLCPTIRDFLQRHVAPSDEALAQGQALLSDDRRRAALIAEIESAIPWFALEPRGEGWPQAFGDFGFADTTLVSFDPEFLSIVRADAAPNGNHMIVEAYGTARLDLGLFKYEAAALPEDSPISVEEFDLNESMSAAKAELSAALILDVLLDDAAPAVSIEEVQPIGEDAIFTLLERWTDENLSECLALVGGGFDVPGTQIATAANPVGVEKFDFRDGVLLARVDFNIDYDNPVDVEDEYMSANNVTEATFDLKIFSPDFERGALGEAILVEAGFPD
jgi:hypothetical protein